MIHRHRIPITALLRGIISAAGLSPWILLLTGQRGACFKPAFRSLCHQIPERTLILGVPMVVCSRCAGIYLGMALGALLPAPRWNSHTWKSLILLSAALMTLDVLTQDLGWHPSLHSLRLSTGLLVGWTSCSFLFNSLNGKSE